MNNRKSSSAVKQEQKKIKEMIDKNRADNMKEKRMNIQKFQEERKKSRTSRFTVSLN